MLAEIQEILIISTPRDINFFKELLEDYILWTRFFFNSKKGYLSNSIDKKV